MGILEVLAFRIFIQFLKNKLKIFDGFFIHLEIFINSNDILDETNKVQLFRFSIYVKRFRKIMKGIIIPSQQHLTQS